MRGRFAQRPIGVHLVLVLLGALVGGVGLLSLSPPATAKDGWTLTGVCTAVEDYPDFRSFRIRNETGSGRDVVLRNTVAGESITVFAPRGDSFHLVPAVTTGSNLTQLLVDGDNKDVAQASPYACAALAGSAVCDPARGVYDVTWTLTNNDGAAHPVLATGPRPLVFTPNPVPAEGVSRATEVLPAPATGSQTVRLEVAVDLGRGEVSRPTAEVTLGQCGDPIPPELSFTFTKTPSVTEAAVGDQVTYTYAGTNTGEVPLEVTQLVDDRLGVHISEPSVETVVPPGESISRTFGYTVVGADASLGVIDNNATVTVRATSGPDLTEKSATAQASVAVASPIEAALSGQAVCDPAAGAYDVTWTLVNNGSLPLDITSSSREVSFAPVPVLPGAEATATETVPPPADTTEISLAVTVDDSSVADPLVLTETLSLGQCEPPVPPEIGFTFTKEADVEEAAIGDTITYTYSGTNTGDVPLEVTQLVDDRLGVVIADPGVDTVVPPDGSISREVTYVVLASDAEAGSIDNAATVTVRPTSGEDQAGRSATAQETVAVLPPAPIQASLSGNAECQPATGTYDVTWTVASSDSRELDVTATAPRELDFQPQPIEPGGTATATETVTPTQRSATLSLSVVLDDDGPAPPVTLVETLTLGVCEPPLIGFTFTKTADREVTRVGQVIVYTYSGTNTGEVPLEVTQLVDDQLGVLIRRAEDTVVEPGDSISEQVRYVATPIDASNHRVHNSAVVSVRPLGGEIELSGVADALVRVVVPADPPAPPDRPSGGVLPDVGGMPVGVLIAGILAELAGLLLLLWARSGRARPVAE